MVPEASGDEVMDSGLLVERLKAILQLLWFLGVSLVDWSSLSPEVNSLGSRTISPLSFLDCLSSSGVPKGNPRPHTVQPIVPFGVRVGLFPWKGVCFPQVKGASNIRGSWWSWVL